MKIKAKNILIKIITINNITKINIDDITCIDNSTD